MTDHKAYRAGRMNVIREDLLAAMTRYLSFRDSLKRLGEWDEAYELDEDDKRELMALLRARR